MQPVLLSCLFRFILFIQAIFPDFPVNIWVASFTIYAFHGSTILQSGVYEKFNRPFPSYLLPLCQNESTWETIRVKMSFTYTFIFMQIKLIFIEGFCTRTRFEDGTKGNSEMAYYQDGKSHCFSCPR